ncbi:MAG: outer membrane beta-barrel protein [Bacteroidales bacterium]|nr:outer membrane beta-barrel protein [Bacteroidales bacterium]
MKKNLLIVLIISNVLYLNAQKSNITEINLGNNLVSIISENNEIIDVEVENNFDFKKEKRNYNCHILSKPSKFDGHHEGIEIGQNNFLNSSFEMKLPQNAGYLELNTGKSWGVNINILEQNFSIIKNHLGIVTGLGLQINNYRFDKDITLVHDSTHISFYNEDDKQFTKNKLTCAYLSIPLMIEVQIPGNSERNVHFAFGTVGGIKIGSHTKQIYTDNNKEFKDKVHKNFHLSKFRYGIIAKIGIEDISLFGQYSFSTLFEKNEGPELYPFMLGISFSI